MQNPGVLWFMIKQWQMAIKMMITIEEPLRIIQKLLDAGVLTQISENCAFFGRPAVGVSQEGPGEFMR